MNALRMLMSQHDLVEGLLVDLSQASGQSREPLLREFARALRRHLDLEEAVFFPAVAPRLILVKAAPFQAEHLELREALAQAEAAHGDVDRAARLDELHDVVVRHISDEEIDLFAEVKRRFSLDELDELGERLEAAGFAGAVEPLEPESRVSAPVGQAAPAPETEPGIEAEPKIEAEAGAEQGTEEHPTTPQG